MTSLAELPVARRPDEVPALALAGACKRFGAVTALDAISLEVRHGEVLALLGDNGAGKSTLIKCLSGVHRLDSGSIEADGVPVSIHAPADARALGIETVYQDLALFDNLRPTDNFYAGRELAGPRWVPRSLRLIRRKQMTDSTRDVLERLRVALPDINAPVGLMSGGQRQAVAIARTRLSEAKIVLMDEPTAAISVRQVAEVLGLIRRLRDAGITVVLISHRMPDVFEVCDRVVVMRRGRKVADKLIASSSPEEVTGLITGAIHVA